MVDGGTHVAAVLFYKLLGGSYGKESSGAFGNGSFYIKRSI